MRESLHNLGVKHRTDKHDGDHMFCGASYLHTYEKYFDSIRDQSLNILEIGVKDGSSHRMWKDYFQNSMIYGIDIDPRCSQSSEDRISISVGSQADQSVINEVFDKTDRSGFDIILDDGSHINSLTLKSFDLLFPMLKQGGLYIIEDLGCSYLEDDLPNHTSRWPGMEYNKDLDTTNRRSTMNTFFNAILRDIDLQEKRFGIEWIHFYSRIAILKKA